MTFLRFFAVAVLSLTFSQILTATTSVGFQNNSGLTLNFELELVSPGQEIPADLYSAEDALFSDAWERRKTLVDIEEAAAQEGATYAFRLNCVQVEDLSLIVELSFPGETPFFNIGATVPGAAPQFTTNPSLVEIDFQFDEQDYLLKFDFTQNENGDYNFLYVLHELQPYTIDPADLENPNVLNVMSYNMWMLPLGDGAASIYQRAESIVDYISENHDVIVLNEIFDDSVRLNYLIPDFEAKGYIHHVGPANEEPENVYASGVMMFSKWPFVFDAEYHYDSCNFTSFDCFANKGIQYGKIEKLGKPYHIFGTHMEAGGDPSDDYIKKSQLGEMRDFIAEQEIPNWEAVVMAGDFNNGPTNIDDGLWQAVQDSLNPIFPEHIGYHTSTFGREPGRVIDHVWVDRNHLIPLNANNDIVILRGIDDNMWRFFTLSDHLTALARLEFPDIGGAAIQTQLMESQCVGETTTLTAGTAPLTFEWLKDGQVIDGATDGSLVLEPVADSDSGDYGVNIGSTGEFGTSDHILTPFFYANGPETISNEYSFELGQLSVVSSLDPPEIQQSAMLFDSLFVSNEYEVVHWYQNGEIIEGETDNVLSPWDWHIEYEVEIDNNGNCPNLFSDILVILGGVEENVFENFHFSAANNSLNVSTENLQNYQLAIFNVSGQMVFSKRDCLGDTIVDNLTGGQIYICEIRNETGRYSEKIFFD